MFLLVKSIVLWCSSFLLSLLGASSHEHGLPGRILSWAYMRNSSPLAETRKVAKIPTTSLRGEIDEVRYVVETVHLSNRSRSVHMGIISGPVPEIPDGKTQTSGNEPDHAPM